MRAILAIVLSLTATALGLAVLAVALVLTTETGLRVTLGQAQAFLPKRFSVSSIDGRLIGPLTIRNLDLKTGTSRLTADHIHFDWSPARLFLGAVVIDRLHVRNARLTSYAAAPPKEPEASEPTDPLALLQPPLAVELNDIALRNFEYRTSESEPFVIERAELAAGLDTRGLHIDTLRATGPLFELEGQASIKPQNGQPTEGELSWQVRLPDYPTAAGHIMINGSLQELHVKQRTEAPYRTQTTVVLTDALTEPHFRAELKLNAINLPAIRKDLPNVTINANAHAKGRATDIEYTARAKVVDPAQGTFMLALDGDLEKQMLDIERLAVTVVDTPTRLQANGRVNLSGEQPNLNLQADWQKLRWPLQGEPQFTSPDGRLAIAGTPIDLTARVDAAVGDTGGLDARIRREKDNIRLALDWHDLNWPLQQPRIASPQGTARVKGTLQQYTLAISTQVDMPEQANGHVIVEGIGSNQSLDLKRIDLKVLQGEIKGNASVVWQPQLDARISLDGAGINPGVLLPEWPGKLALQIQASAQQAEKLTAQLAALDITGRLRNQDFALKARGDYRGDALRLERLSLVSGSSTVQASGTIGSTLGIDWRIDSENLTTLWPGTTGSLHGQGEADGPLRQPRVKATLTGEGLRYTQYKVGQLDFQTDVDLQGQTQSSVELNLQNGAAAGVELSKVRFIGYGTPQDHELELAANTDTGDAELRLDGRLRQSIWSFRLNQARLKYPTLPAWTLAEPTQGRVSTEAQDLERTCWVSAQAKLCLRGQRSAAGLQASFQLERLPFGYFAEFLPTNIDLKGKLSGHGEIRQPSGAALAADVQIETSAGEILAATDEINTLTPVLRFKSAEIHADLGDRGLELGVDLPLVDQGGLQMNAQIPAGDKPLTARPLNGAVYAQIRDIGFLAKLAPDIERIAGRLHGQMQISGTLAQPVLLGRLALLDGSARLLTPGLDITDLSLEIIGQRDGGLNYSVDAKSGGGTLRLAGNADLTGVAPRAEMQIDGQNFQALNTDDAQVFISPTLQISLDAAGITVNGEVRVPRADITPKKIPPSAVTVSEDQVIVRPDQETPAVAAARKLHVRVRLILGEDVHFEGFGLKGRLEGRLLVVQQPEEPTKGSGELRIVEGEYRAYGQGLVIDTGRVLFAGGPIDQPGIDIRAVRHPAENITVGVQARGTLKQPKLTIFSDPSMTQAEQLSWLVLGRPLQGASSSENSMLMQAALALGLKGGDFLAKKLGGSLGVDTIGIETGSGEAGAANNTKEASLVVGKYLSPDLYVSYGIGLFDQVSTVKLQYTLSSHWQLVTESSRIGTGGDVIYTLER
ncbi:MAG: translocation/assembly module TamB domain-containing protein [Nitrococcus mobilis]|nr:translocation/assembly module TamB domain-containing protein [Nitrococcus mobilis]